MKSISYLDYKEMLQEFIAAYGPPGLEDEIRGVAKQKMGQFADDQSVDPIGNLILKINGKNPNKTPIRLVAHLDEIAMIVKRIHDDGTLHLRGLGCLYPNQIGQGPVEILSEKPLKGVLSFGCTHVSPESEKQYATIPEGGMKGSARARTWNDVVVLTGKTKEELMASGVGPGTRVVIEKKRRELFEFSDLLGSYYMDDRAPMTILWALMKTLKEEKIELEADIYFVFTTNEEIAADGASYGLSRIPGDVTIAIEVAPVQKEYGVELNPYPVIAYQDRFTLYDYHETEKLRKAGERVSVPMQRVVLENFGSDASIAKSYGHVSKALNLSIPTANTHGFEVIHKESMENAVKVLLSYLKGEK